MIDLSRQQTKLRPGTDFYETEAIVFTGAEVRRLVIPPGKKIPKHKQANTEVWIVNSGTAKINGEVTDIFVCRPGESHCLENIGSEDVEVLAVQIDLYLRHFGG